MKTLGLTLGLVLFSVGVLPGASLSWNNAAGGNWNDPLNWTPNQVPGAGDTATITANGTYTVQITDARTILNVTVGGGTGAKTLEIAGAGSLTLTGTMGGPGLVRVLGVLNWNSGTMSGPGTTEIASGGTLNLNTAAGKSLDNTRVIDNSGTIGWIGTGALTGTSASVINNSGLIDLTTDSTLNWGFVGGVPVLNNLSAGTVRKSSGAGTFSFLNVTINQSGTFDAQSGNIDLSSGVTVNGNTGSTFIGAGSALTRLVGGTLTAAAGQTPGVGDHFEFVSGTFTGPGVIRITGEMIWSGGAMNAVGTTRVEAGATLRIAGSGSKQFDAGRIIENRGLVRYVGTGALSGSSAPKIVNSGEFRIENDSTINWAFSGGSPVFDNLAAGLITKTAGGGVFDFANVVVNNAGTVEAQVGTIQLSGGGTESGVFTTSAGGIVAFRSGTFDCDTGTSFSGLGTIQLNGGTISVPLTVTATIVAGTRFEFSSGTLQGVGDFEVLGTMAWTGGTMAQAGTTRVSAGSTLELAGSATKSFGSGRVIENNGLVRWTGSGGLTGFSAPVFANNSELRIENDSTLNWASSGGVPTFDNLASGIVRKSAGAGTFTFQTLVFNQFGTFDAQSGNIDLSGVSVNGNTGSTFIGTGSALTRFVGGTFTTAAGQMPGIGDHFEFVSGTFTGPGVIRITGEMIWSGGSMSGLGTTRVEPGATLRITGNGGKGFDTGRIIENRGLVRYVGTGALSGSSAPKIVNSGEFRIENDSAINWAFSGGTPVFDNLSGGVIRKTAGGGVFDFAHGSVNNAGTVDAQIGMIRLSGGGTESGPFVAAPGAAIEFTGGTFNWNSGTSFSGLGTFRLNGGTIDVALATIAVGTRFEYSSGILQGVGQVEVSGTMIWSGGDMSQAGTTRIMSGGTLELAGAGTKLFGLGRVIENNGLVRWTGTGPLSGYSAPVFRNLGEFRIESDSTINWAFSGGTPVFDNLSGGVIRKTAGGGVFDFANGSVNNAGTVDAQIGMIRLSGGGTESGPFVAAPGAAIEFTAGTFNWNSGTSFSGLGTLRLNGGTIDVALATIATIAVGTRFEYSSGILQGVGQVEVSGTMIWSGGDMSQAGTTRIMSGGTLELAGAGTKFFGLGRVIENNGLVRWTGNGPLSGYSASQFANNSELRIETDSVFNWAFSGGVPTFNNNVAGSIVKTAGTGALSFDNSTVTKRGLVRVESGQVRFNGNSTCSGVFMVLTGARVDFAAGTHTFDGNSSWDGAGTYRIQATVSINNGLTVDANALVELTGTIRGLGTFLISEQMDWSSGDMTDAGTTRVAPTGTLELTGGGTKFVGRTLENLGTIRVTGNGSWSGYNGGVVNNRNLVRIETPANAVFNWAFSGAFPTFNNHAGATIVKVGAAPVFGFDNCTLNNDGTVQADAGTIRMNAGGTSTGAFVAGNGGTVEHAGGSQTDTGGEVRALAGGTVRFSGGTFVLTGGGTLAAPGTLQIAGGTLQIGAAVNASVAGTFDMSNGTLGGAGVIVLQGTGIWSSGDMTDAGTTRIAAGGALELAGGFSKTFGLGRVIENNGLVRWTGNGALTGYSGPVFNNNAELRIEADSALNWNGVGATPTLVNNASGLVVKTAGTAAFSFVNITLTKRGPVRGELGRIQFNSSSTCSGQFTVLTGARIDFAAGTHAFDGDATWDGAGTYGLQATVVVNDGFTVNANGLVELTGGIRGLGTFLISQRTVWSNGDMSEAGITRVGATGILELSGGSSKSFGTGRNIDNLGTIQWTGPGALTGYTGPQLNNRALLHLQTDAVVNWNGIGERPRFENLPAGIVRIGVSGPATAQITELTLQNTVVQLAGTLQVDLLGGYSPSINDALTVIPLPGNSTANYGTFATILPLVFGTGLKFEPHYDLAQVRIVTIEAPQTTITQHPVSATVECGNNHTFTVAATGSGTLTYQWRRNGVNIVGATGPTFTLSPARSSDAGTYDVVTDSSTAATSNPATLTVNDTQPPTVTCPLDIVTSATDLAGIAVTFNPTASDVCDTAPTITCSPSSGSVFPVGTTSVTCTARDAANLTANCVFSVTVHFCQEFGSTVNQPIPDNDAAGLTRTITVASPIISLVDVNVLLKVTGGRNGDLHARLTHSSGAAFLLNRVGRTSGNPDGYADAGLDVLLDDQAATGDIHLYQLQPFTSPVTGLWQPDGRSADPSAVLDTDPREALLDEFNGLNPSGTWTLVIADRAANNVATLVSWGLQLCGAKDTTAPAIVTCAPATSIDANGICQAQVPDLTGQVDATDNSGVAPTVSQSPAPGTIIGGLGNTPVTLSVRDLAGNTATCVTTLTVRDVTPPTLTTCPPSQSLPATSGCDAALPDLTLLAAATDCSGTATLSQTPAPGTALGPGLHTVTIHARDSAGNESTCNVGVTVSETTAPVITACAPAISLNANASCQATLPDLRFQVVAADCNLPLSVVQSPAGGTSVGLGAHAVSFVVRDAGGNESTCSTTVTVVDVLRPVIAVCAAHRTISADGTCVALVPDFRGEVVASDCNGPVVVTQSPAPGTSVGLGAHGVSLTARDAAGNTESCALTLTVRDDTAPAIVACAPDQTLVGNATCSATLPDLRGSLTATDCGGPVTITQDPAPGSPLSLGNHPVTFTVRDAAGNSANCQATISVQESIAPVIAQCAPNRTVVAGPTCTAPAPDLTGLVQATDCDLPLSFSQSPAPGAPLPLGANVITITVRDAGGNAATCTATVTVNDEAVPVIVTCAPDGSAVADANCHVPAPDLRNAVGAADCNGPLSYSQVPPPGEPLSVGIHPITIVVADAANNVISCTAQFTVTDAAAPVITTCPAPRTLPGGAGCDTPLPDLRPELVAVDCNGPLTVTQVPAHGALLAPGTHTVTLTVRDAAGNATPCSVAITIDSSTGLAIASCAPNQTLASNASCEVPVPDLTGQVVASSCSPPVTITQNPAAGTTVGLGAHTVVLTARDAAGNSATCSATVTVRDETAPVIATCAGNQTVAANASCQATVPNLTGSVVANDCNGPVTITQNPAAGTTVGLGVHTVVLTARDAAGNSATCSATVTVRDETAPVIATCAGNQTVAANASCQAAVPNLTGSVVANDCNGPVTITQNPAAGNTVGLGAHTVVLTAQDAAGNSSTCSVTVTVRDETAPVIGTTPDLTVPATGSSGAVVTFAVTAIDGCPGTPVVVCNPASGTLFAIGTTVVQCTATDTAGNQASRSFSVTVNASGNQPPIARSDLLLVLQSQPVTFPISALLRNDSDPDGQTIQFVSVDSVSTRGGSITVTGDQVTYRQPATGIPFPVGIDSFRYRISDGVAAPVQGVVNVLISRVPRTGIVLASAHSEDECYEVQRTVDFVEWTTLPSFSSDGNPTAILDSNPPEEMAFYRIIPCSRNASNP